MHFLWISLLSVLPSEQGIFDFSLRSKFPRVSQSGTFLFPDDNCCFKTDCTKLQILIMETTGLIFKKCDSIFSKKLTLSCDTAIVILFIKPQISQGLYSPLDLKYSIKLEMGRREGPYYIAFSSFFPFPHLTHTILYHSPNEDCQHLFVPEGSR